MGKTVVLYSAEEGSNPSFGSIMKDVTIYTTDTCNYCHDAMKFFDAHGIEYTEKNVGRNPKALKEFKELTNKMSVPLIKIGKDAIHGFDQKTIERMLELK